MALDRSDLPQQLWRQIVRIGQLAQQRRVRATRHHWTTWSTLHTCGNVVRQVTQVQRVGQRTLHAALARCQPSSRIVATTMLCQQLLLGTTCTTSRNDSLRGSGWFAGLGVGSGLAFLFVVILVVLWFVLVVLVLVATLATPSRIVRRIPRHTALQHLRPLRQRRILSKLHLRFGPSALLLHATRR
jgi:hypothetical protein